MVFSQNGVEVINEMPGTGLTLPRHEPQHAASDNRFFFGRDQIYVIRFHHHSVERVHDWYWSGLGKKPIQRARVPEICILDNYEGETWMSR
jgi:hypothetical protein